MALITTAAELRSTIPRLFSSLSDVSEMPNIGKAQRKYINPILGKAFLEDLELRYSENNLGNDEELLKLIQLPLAAYTMLDDLAFTQVTITDSGIRTMGTDDMQALHRWEYNELKKNIQDLALDGVEQLLQFLFENKDAYTLWTDSHEYQWNNSFLIKNGTDFSKHYKLSAPYFTYWQLRPIMMDVEENYFAGALGRDLLLWVKGAGQIDVIDSGLVNVKYLLEKAMAFLSIKEACSHLNVRLDANGFTVLTDGGESENPATDGKKAAPSDAIEKVKKAAEVNGQNFLSKVGYYLSGLGNGKFEHQLGDDFKDAFSTSPLKIIPNKRPRSNGNERRGFFR